MRKLRLWVIRNLCLLPLIAAVGVGVGCGSSGSLRLSSDATGRDLFEQAQEELEKGRWRQAAEAFDALLRNYPTSPFLPEARLGLGRAYYERHRVDTLLLAVDAFRTFITYHPSHERVDYAQLMIGMSFASTMRAADRDQSGTLKAVEAFEVFLEDYPDSPYLEAAKSRLQETRDRLAEHELKVARWQLDHGIYRAARERSAAALERYPDTSLGCDLTFVLAEAYRRDGQSVAALRQYQALVEKYAACQRADEARERLSKMTASTASADGSEGG